MAKVITLSRFFLSYHPKAGKSTFFIEKFYNNIGVDFCRTQERTNAHMLNSHHSEDLISPFFDSLNVGILEGSKGHTVRAGHRFKPGDYCSPRTWGAVPYRSQQIILAPDLLIPKTFDFEIRKNCKIYINKTEITKADIEKVALNDGLSAPDMLAWFKWPAPFDGQIICWDKSIEY